MGLRIQSLATSLPRHQMPQQLSAEWAAELSGATKAQAHVQHEVFRRTGIRTRGSVLLETNGDGSLAQSFYKRDEPAPTTQLRMERYASESVQLAIQAAAPAVAQSGFDPSTITHIITVSCTGCIAPGLDRALSAALGLSNNILCTNIGFMGCAGVFNAWAAAKPIIEAQPNARVLICAVEICTLHFRFESDMQQVIANSLFADGAGAMVAARGDSSRPAQSWALDGIGSQTIPNSTDALGWRIGDHGFKMNLSAELPNLIQQHLRSWLEPWLAQHDLSISDISTWAIHPGGPRILDAAAESLGLPPHALAVSNDVLCEFGNMSSPTILFILQKLRNSQAPRPCVAIGFGPGVVAHAALFR